MFLVITEIQQWHPMSATIWTGLSLPAQRMKLNF
jgi:hypothetical protein